ncbi:MAG: hypothetical protein QOK30_2557 [Nocardioidaceae bacterium]|nr:hypothetical protein [Nocardioidaceae bacterium]
MSTGMSAGPNPLRSGAGRSERPQGSVRPDDVLVATDGEPVRPTPAATSSARLVYPPVAEERPSSRPVLITALAALVFLVAAGVLLVRHGQSSSADPASGPATTTTSSASAADVVSQVSFGPGLVLSESQHFVFDKPVSRVRLAVPKQAATAGGGAFDPHIGNLQILMGDGAPMNVRQSLRPGTSITVPLPAAGTRLDVVYVAYHAIVRSEPSSQHRAVALVTPLTLASTSGLTSTLHIGGDNVTNIGCTKPDGTSQSCGSESSDGWTVIRTPQQQRDAVIAQLDLQP